MVVLLVVAAGCLAGVSGIRWRSGDFACFGDVCIAKHGSCEKHKELGEVKERGWMLDK
jgi:hypothetical protein